MMVVLNCVATDSSDQRLEVAGKAPTDCEVRQQETAASPHMQCMEYVENLDSGRRIGPVVGCPPAEDTSGEGPFLIVS